MERRLNIAIAGAGLGGLAAAVALRDAGVNVRVFEQARQFARVGAGIQMPPNAMKVLRAIGAEQGLLAIGLQPVSNLNLEHDTGRVTNELPLAGVMEQRYGAPFLCVHRADLHAALHALLPEGSVSLDMAVVGFEQGQGGVTLRFGDGTSETFDALIGADGIHSFVREQLFGPANVRYSGRVAYRSTYPASRLGGLTFAPSRIKWWGPDRHIVNYYTRRSMDEVYVQTVQPDPGEWITKESWSATADLKVATEAFCDFHPDIRAVLQACPSVHKWALLNRDPMPQWSVGRVTLLGDACHAMLQHMAQGGAQALEDAAILARCVAGVPSDGVEAALARYERNRKSRTASIQEMAAQNTWMRAPTNPDWVYGYDALQVALEP
jgi:2-polyprenyl-6-methoxyphenol hydroxylase-like FAD-dependent oxidoreductase